MKKIFLGSVCGVGLLFFAAMQTHAWTIAQRGKPVGCVIVLPQKPSEAETYAAKELQQFTKRMTGVELPIADKAVEGKSAIVFQNGKKDMSRDTFRLVVQGKQLHVEAGSDSGILYGVYELLEKYGGCRWYSSWCEKVPTVEIFSVPDRLNDTQKPAFLMREPFWTDMIRNPDFACRNRVNGGEWMTFGKKHGGTPYRYGGELHSCHTFNLLCPPEKYFDSHPEYFSEIDGKRRKDRTQLCLTNPDVLRIVTSNVLARIRKDPGAAFYGISQNDWYNYCTCPKCKEIDDREESHSGTMIAFINQIAEAVEKEFPDVIVETLAYQYTRKPPKHIKPRANVMPCLCTIECDFSHAIPKSSYKENVKFLDDIKGWGAICKQVYIWDYCTDFAHYTAPFPNVLGLQDNLRFFRANQVNYIYEEGAYQGQYAEFAELKAWLQAKWMWNTELPQEELLQDFFSGFYGKGAPYVRLYFDALHSFYRDPAKHPLGCFADVVNKVIPDEFYERANLLWDLADQAVKGEPEVIQRNVRIGRFPVLYAQFMRTRFQQPVAWVARNPAPILEKLQQSRDLAKRLIELDAFAGGIRLAEGESSSQKRNKEWHELVDGGIPVPKAADTAVIEEEKLKLYKPGQYGDRIQDPQAGDGWAYKLFASHYEWCVMLDMSSVAYDPGAKYRISARLRVDKKENAKGQAFWSGVYDYSKNRDACHGYAPQVQDVKDGYQWYAISTWNPAKGHHFWFGPGMFDKKQTDRSLAHNGIYLDCIKIERVVE
ncbi:MAG: DUF4838 domain-containing protein [Kiritimatiellae bacterium]|nr:DUF4838 domain-containing protein [Kiritimatiellia bacterium]